MNDACFSNITPVGSVGGLHLILASGLPARLLAPLRRMEVTEGFISSALTASLFREKIGGLARARGVKIERAIRWASAAEVDSLEARLMQAGFRLVWKGGEGYPARLVERLGVKAPPWLLLRGEAARADGPLCAMVGSRSTHSVLLEAANGLAAALSGSGTCIVSGLAQGADQASHAGAVEGEAGSIAMPARGLLTLSGPEARLAGHPHMTLLGMGRPLEDFSAGLALRRNDAIAALGDALILVAGDLKGGSSYAVNRALETGRPVFAFEAGPNTPPGNALLLRNGLATALPIGAPPAGLATAVKAATERAATHARPVQLDWVGDAA